ncbi:hypothetical protein HGRIS_003496 [Hohenbuehelia grisea]|uniref:WD40 repeat-like protein n=1 Tax=Hohenbuehelia grisea TaxID=104357 RepID=A0ABR3JFN1_9AGAR
MVPASSKRRISYVVPSPTTPVPRLQLPPHDASRLGSIAPLLIPAPGYATDRARGDIVDSVRRKDSEPRHRLGVASLALDTSTQLFGQTSPEGILYSGGRDGLVLSWELGVPMKRKSIREGDGPKRAVARWETMTGWGDDGIEDDGEDVDDRLQSDGDVLGDVTGGIARRRRRTLRSTNDVPYELQWETDYEAFKPGRPSKFRQSAQLHTDWVNDILLCNLNQTLVSASSDGTIKAWNPHSPHSPDPSLIGSHADYVRCLTYCREQNWIASGSFDRTIKLWDLNQSTQSQSSEALITLNPADASAPKSSVYAIAADPFGHAIASGSPERVVRLWDPRSGKRTGKLVGHTDNIRAILISDDSKYLLTGAADASIKLWSLSSQRCLHTFTHHTESVWSLHSSHPSFETFYSGDRSGLVCKVDVENCSDLGDGECIVLCQDATGQGAFSSEGVNKIVAMDDNLLWTASGTSDIKRWRVPQKRSVRAAALVHDQTDIDGPGDESPPIMSRRRASRQSPDPPPEMGGYSRSPRHRHSTAPSIQTIASDSWTPQRELEDSLTLYGIPYQSLVRLTSPNDPFMSYSTSASPRGRDPEVSTLYSSASVASMSRPVGSALRSPFSVHNATIPSVHTSPMRSGMTGAGTVDSLMHSSAVAVARAEYEVRELAADAKPLCEEPDDVIQGEHGLVRSVILNDRMHALTVDTAGEVAVWDIVRGVCRGRYTAEDVSAASQRGSVVGSGSHSGSGAGAGASVPKERSPREALETVRERIEGEAVVMPWSTVAAKTGVLTVNLNDKCFDAEVYADEVGFKGDRHFNDESRLNIAKWVLRNLFLGFILEEQQLQRAGVSHVGEGEILAANFKRSPNKVSSPTQGRSPSASDASVSSRRSTKSPKITTVVSAADLTPALPPSEASSQSKSVRSSPLITPLIPLHNLSKDAAPGTIPLPPIPQSPPVNSSEPTPLPAGRLRSGTIDGGLATAPPTAMPQKDKDGDYFSISRVRKGSIQGGGAPATPDDFSGWGGPGKASATSNGASEGAVSASVPTTPGGLMGRLKNFGKSATKKVTGDVTSSPVIGATQWSADTPIVAEPEEILPAEKSPLEVLLSTPFTPPTSADAPRHPFPQHATIVITEDAPPGIKTIYRGTVACTSQDVQALEEAMPMWLLEYLLLNKAPELPINKLSFILLPWRDKDPNIEPLPELLNTAQSKLTASRFLRVRKLAAHVQDKLDKIASGQPVSSSGSVRTSSDSQQSSPGRASRPRAEDLYEILCGELILPLDMCLAAVRQYVWRQSGELVMHYRKKTISTPRPALLEELRATSQGPQQQAQHAG